MATVSKEIADVIIRNNGIYPGDEHMPVVRIVAYNNQFNGELAHGLVYQGDDPDKYHNAPACHNPRTIFERQS